MLLLVTGHGDVTYNPRRKILGVISVAGKIAYHLYNFSISKAGNYGQLIRKSRWPPNIAVKRVFNKFFYGKLIGHICFYRELHSKFRFQS